MHYLILLYWKNSNPKFDYRNNFKTLHLTTPQSHIPLLCNYTYSILVLFASWLERGRNRQETAPKLKSRVESACTPLSELALVTKRKVAKRQVAKRRVAKRQVAKRRVAKRQVANRQVAKRRLAKKQVPTR